MFVTVSKLGRKNELILNCDSIVDVQSGIPSTGERPSVFLSETSALILVVEIGFLRHRSRRRRGTRWSEEGKSGEAEKRPAAAGDETDRLRGPFTHDVRVR